MKYLILLPFVALLAACGHTGQQARPEPIVVPIEASVPIAGACVPDTLGDKPVYLDTKEKLTAAADAAERLQLLYAGRAQRQARLNEIEPIIAGCPRGTVKK
jgi:hypothetical protein